MSNMSCFPRLVFLLSVSSSNCVSILSQHALKCSRQDLRCTASYNNCLDRGWLNSHRYTPTGPERLQAVVDTRLDEAGQLQPVLKANWTLKDDGSIRFLNATELHVLVMPTNEHVCVRYTFKDVLSMRSPSDEKWLFFSDVLVLNPGEEYFVSVYNIPKPELDHTNNYVSDTLRVPGCRDPRMMMTQFCIERGSLWKPNITLVHETANSSLAVSFRPDVRCHLYIVIVKCGSIQQKTSVHKVNQSSLHVRFSLDRWPRSCCQFVAEIIPSFPQCKNDCPRKMKPQDVCPVEKARNDPPAYLFVAIGVMSMCVVLAAMVFVAWRKRGTSDVTTPQKKPETLQPAIKQAPKVLVIYSQDHRLYRDVVLKLCSFLQARCGTRVLVDLLDTSSVSMVGRLRWLEWQRQQLSNPSDKILVLCSRGVQAKWRAMCGQGQVKLREDVLSPTDDMLIPFLNLFLPDMHQAGMLGKYMVAYFEDISSEKDVPSVFDIGVKYNLMKHFEELYFRILDIEKYQPGQVNHIEGIGVDEYSSCASGRALKDAIETFQTYQIQNPDWFEKECVDSEEEVVSEASRLIQLLPSPPVLECVPGIRDEPPVYLHNVDIVDDCNSVHVLTPQLNPEQRLSSVVELVPAESPRSGHLYPSQVGKFPHSAGPPSVYVANPVLKNQSLVQQNWVSLREPLSVQRSAEDDEEDYFPNMIKALYDYSEQRIPPNPSSAVQSQIFPSPEISLSQPLEMEEEDLVPSAKRSSSGSDQGYISRWSPQQEAPSAEDPLKSLARLQEELFQMSSDGS